MNQEHHLTPGERSLVRVAAAMAARDQNALAEALEQACHEDAPSRVEEVILQGYLFLGYPAALNTFGLWRRISGQEAPDPSDEAPASWGERGQAVCRTVYGGQYERLRSNIRRLHPDMERWMVAEGYGKVLGRQGLELKVRELCIAGLLAVHGMPRQLYSHLRGALNAGATPEEVQETLQVAERYMGRAEFQEASAVWAEVRDSRRG